MTLTTLDPFALVRDLDRAFQAAVQQPSRGEWLPRVDVFDRDSALVVRAEVAGIDPETLEITLEGGVLSLSGARRFAREESDGEYRHKEIFEGEFRRSISLPEGLDLDGVNATSAHGVLEVVIPRSPEVLPKKVQIQIGT